MTNCKNCSKRLRGWQYRLIGYCYQCHTRSFQVSRRRLPPYRRWHKGGWQALLSASDLERWRQWENEIIARIDKEELTAKSAKGRKGRKIIKNNLHINDALARQQAELTKILKHNHGGMSS